MSTNRSRLLQSNNVKWLFETTLQPLFHLSNAFQQRLSVVFYRTQVSLDFFRFSCKDHPSFTPSLVLVIRHVFHFTSKMLFAMGDDLSYGLNTLGPLCLWQCFKDKSVTFCNSGLAIHLPSPSLAPSPAAGAGGRCAWLESRASWSSWSSSTWLNNTSLVCQIQLQSLRCSWSPLPLPFLRCIVVTEQSRKTQKSI